MHPVNAASAPTGMFSAVGVEDFTNFQLLSAASLVLTSFAFAFPAAVAWHTKQLWHAWMFGTMILTSVTYSYCSTEFPKHGLGLTAGCDPETTQLLLRVSNAGLYLCSLQMALLLLCPKDPKLQQERVLARLGSAASAGRTATPASLVEGAAALISKGEASQQASSVPDTAASSSEGGAPTSSSPPPSLPPQHLSLNAPADVIFCSRVIPVAAFALLNYIHAGSEWEDAQRQSVLLSSTSLAFCCTSFWLQQERRSLAPTVLLRLQYWRRLGHSRCVPSMLSIALLAMANSAESKVLHSLWQVVLASFAVGVLRNIIRDGSAASTPAAQSPPSVPLSGPPTTATAAAALVPAAASPCDDITLLDASQADFFKTQEAATADTTPAPPKTDDADALKAGQEAISAWEGSVDTKKKPRAVDGAPARATGSTALPPIWRLLMFVTCIAVTASEPSHCCCRADTLIGCHGKEIKTRLSGGVYNMHWTKYALWTPQISGITYACCKPAQSCGTFLTNSLHPRSEEWWRCNPKNTKRWDQTEKELAGLQEKFDQ